jgi:hypothetical protein
MGDSYGTPPEEQQMRKIFSTTLVVQLLCAGATMPDVAFAQSAPAAPAANPTGTAVKAFQDRLNEWVAFHNKVESTVPRLTETSDPAKLAARERALGEALIKERPNPMPGEYMIKEFQTLLAKTIKADFAKRTAAERKALIVELPKNVKFGINMLYPTTIPLATFPANLLNALPDLPPDLEYRIVYRHLILRDVDGNYVVDMLPNVFPIPM